ncbi:uncharacterized protein VTP21DRAFT_7421 [Calcarisporiella thermophila]|uniref:uncharacterized protein n=1 Tax=Calcarisporiella thermophila TaxID=911321 RepID=UPI0037446AA9
MVYAPSYICSDCGMYVPIHDWTAHVASVHSMFHSYYYSCPGCAAVFYDADQAREHCKYECTIYSAMWANQVIAANATYQQQSRAMCCTIL